MYPDTDQSQTRQSSPEIGKHNEKMYSTTKIEETTYEDTFETLPNHCYECHRDVGILLSPCSMSTSRRT